MQLLCCLSEDLRTLQRGGNRGAPRSLRPNLGCPLLTLRLIFWKWAHQLLCHSKPVSWTFITWTHLTISVTSEILSAYTVPSEFFFPELSYLTFPSKFSCSVLTPFLVIPISRSIRPQTSNFNTLRCAISSFLGVVLGHHHHH